MNVSRATCRLYNRFLSEYRDSFLRPNHHQLAIFSDEFHSLLNSVVFTGQVSYLHRSVLNTSLSQRSGICSLASPQIDETENKDAAAAKINGETETSYNLDAQMKTPRTDKRRRRRSYFRTAFSDSDSDVKTDLSKDDLIKLMKEKNKQLDSKDEEIQKIKHEALLAYADMENRMDRTKREAANSMKFAVQNFAKSLLDVADNLGRASSAVKEHAVDATNAVSLLKTLLEGVEMTEKQLAEVLKKFGVEKYDPVGEQFDPHRHNAVLQVPDPSKAAGTISVVLKPGYMLHDRIIRPAEVGVTAEIDN